RVFSELARRYPKLSLVWGSLEEYGAELAAHAAALPTRRGELMDPARDHTREGHYLIAHTLSSRYPLKQRNDACQALLEKVVEPLLLAQQLAEGPPPELAYLHQAWTWLLQNHPHDSICGCSIDQVHRDMIYRFDQCRLLGEGCVRRAMS